jgi:tripartite-type tricarboxylate transporter receptor subunit TctC
MNSLLRGALLVATLLLPFVAHAQDDPNRPVRILVPYPTGGASDVTARVIADKLTKKRRAPGCRTFRTRAVVSPIRICSPVRST